MRTLESAVRHDVRLDILGSLDYAGPLGAEELSARIGRSLTETGYHAAILATHGLVLIKGGVYEAVAHRADWITEAIEIHQVARRITPSAGLPSPRMAGMKCEHCERLLQYKSRVVLVGEADGERQAQLVTEDTLASDAGGLKRPVKYHLVCYDRARGDDPYLPPLDEPE